MYMYIKPYFKGKLSEVCTRWSLCSLSKLSRYQTVHPAHSINISAIKDQNFGRTINSPPPSPLIFNGRIEVLFVLRTFSAGRNFKARNTEVMAGATVRNRDRVRGSNAHSRGGGMGGRESRFNRSFKEQRRSEKANSSAESRDWGNFSKITLRKRERSYIFFSRVSLHCAWNFYRTLYLPNALVWIRCEIYNMCAWRV